MTLSFTPGGPLFLPEPAPRDVRYTVISVDDHLVEPANMFEGRLPRRLQKQAPKVAEIVIHGNTHVASDTILSVLRTKVGDEFSETVMKVMRSTPFERKVRIAFDTAAPAAENEPL